MSARELLEECRGYIANYLEGIDGAPELVVRIDTHLATVEDLDAIPALVEQFRNGFKSQEKG